MADFMGPMDIVNASTTSKADYRVTTGHESYSDLAASESKSQGTEGDTGQNPISQDPGWDGNVTTNYVDDGIFHNSPVSKPDGPDQQGQLLRGYVLNGPDVTAKVESEGAAFQKGPLYKPRISTISDPNPSKAR